MGAYKANIHHSMLVHHDPNQPIGIAFDVENNTVIRHKTGSSKNRFDIRRFGPD
jgi:hypothetical protein